MHFEQIGVGGNELPPRWQDVFVSDLLPRVKAQARFHFRHMSPNNKEEAEAESVAVALTFFVRLIEHGRNAGVLVRQIARVAVLRVKSGRLVGSGQRSCDVLSWLARKRRGFRVTSIDDGDADCVWRETVVEDRQSTPAEIAAARIDIGEWLNAMTTRRRQIAEMLAAGYRTDEVAGRFGVSAGRISQLRRDFEASWNNLHGETNERHRSVA
jgi:hypothetical protein